MPSASHDSSIQSIEGLSISQNSVFFFLQFTHKHHTLMLTPTHNTFHPFSTLSLLCYCKYNLMQMHTHMNTHHTHWIAATPNYHRQRNVSKKMPPKARWSRTIPLKRSHHQNQTQKHIAIAPRPNLSIQSMLFTKSSNSLWQNKSIIVSHRLAAFARCQ